MLKPKRKIRKPNSKKKMREPNTKHTQFTARDQQFFFLTPPHGQKTAKGRRETPKAKPKQ
jgi:hypothetical protein